MDRSGPGAKEVSRAAIGSRGSDIAPKVVTHLGFQSHVGMNIKAKTPANADVINIRVRRAETKVVCEHAKLKVIVGEPGTLGPRQGRQSQGRDQHSKNTQFP